MQDPDMVDRDWSDGGALNTGATPLVSHGMHDDRNRVPGRPNGELGRNQELARAALRSS